MRIVLCRPQEPGNIGAAARAMRTMGLSDLALVAPREPWLTEQAHGLAHGSQRLLHAARVFPDLASAVADCHLVIGTTSRRRNRALRFLDARETAQVVADLGARRRAALVFGNERTGLTNDELALCHHVARIPAAVRQPSLNLAQSVMIFAYERFRLAAAASSPGRGTPALARSESIERGFAHFDEAIRLLDFPPNVEKRFLLSIRNVLSRALLREREVNLLHTLAAQLERRHGR
jgi:tRNA (cytidine32/uridine32-2'-O)-methyltransferase